MRISPINNNVAFKSIVNIDPKANKEIFGDRYYEFETLSDSKGINIIPLRLDAGPMVNKVDGYVVALQEPSGAVLKYFNTGISKDCVEKLQNNIIQTLIWTLPESNFSAAEYIKNSEYGKANPKAAGIISSLLYSAATSPESKAWRAKLDTIG